MNAQRMEAAYNYGGMMCLKIDGGSVVDSLSALGRVNILNGAGRIASNLRAKMMKMIREMKFMKRGGRCGPIPLIAGFRIKES